MAMVKLDKLMLYVEPHVSGCPPQLIVHELRNAARDFFRESHAWVEEVDQFKTQVDLETYELIDLDNNKEIISISKVERNSDGQEIQVDYDPITRSITIQNPDSQSLVRVYAVLQMSMSSDKVPDWVIQHYPETIADGAMSRLMLMPGLEWSNPQLGQFRARRFRAGVIEARTRRNRQNTEKSTRVKQKRFV